MLNKGIIILFFVLSSLVSFAQEISNTEKTQLLNKLKEKAQNTETLQADFKQEKHLDILSDKITSEGQIFLKTPSKLKWEYDKPFKYTIILTGKEILIDDEGDKTEFNIESSKIFNQVSELVINSVKGNLIDEEQFEASYFKENGNYRVELTPQDQAMAEYFDQIILFIDPTSYLVNRINLNEPSGDYTIIQFDKHKINEDIPDNAFTL